MRAAALSSVVAPMFGFGSGTIPTAFLFEGAEPTVNTVTPLPGKESVARRAPGNSIRWAVVRFFAARLLHVTWEQIRTYFLLNSRLAAIHRTSNNLIKWLR